MRVHVQLSIITTFIKQLVVLKQFLEARADHEGLIKNQLWLTQSSSGPQCRLITLGLCRHCLSIVQTQKSDTSSEARVQWPRASSLDTTQGPGLSWARDRAGGNWCKLLRAALRCVVVRILLVLCYWWQHVWIWGIRISDMMSRQRCNNTIDRGLSSIWYLILTGNYGHFYNYHDLVPAGIEARRENKNTHHFRNTCAHL